VAEYAVPTLPSRSLHETLAFYERLGFVNAGDAPDVWDYVIIRRGTIELHFYADADVDPFTTSAGCFVWVADADALHAEWERAGVTRDPATGSRLVAPTDTEYGVRTFAVIDPSGNQIRFGTGPH
jgi:catechol 2,3-dioxygenase-like lactoylglutathione lyase family enzyme